MLQGRDLLLLLEQLLLVLLVLGLCLLGAGDGVVCLLAEGLEALSTRRERVRGASTSCINCAHLLDSLHGCRSCVWLVVKMGGRGGLRMAVRRRCHAWPGCCNLIKYQPWEHCPKRQAPRAPRDRPKPRGRAQAACLTLSVFLFLRRPHTHTSSRRPPTAPDAP